MSATVDAVDQGVTHLLVVSVDNGVINRLISHLRNAGLPLRPALASSTTQLASLLTQEPWDLLLLQDSADISITDTLALLDKHQQELPVVLLRSREPTDGELLPLLRQGIRAVVAQGSPDRLVAELTREAQQVALRNKLRRRERQLQELEKRDQQILNDSTVALAYVLDGVHLYCNPAYAALFGYPDVGAITTTPLLNLLTVPARAGLRTLLTAAEQGTHCGVFSARRHDGSDVDLQFTFTPVDYQGKTCLQLRVQAPAGNLALEAEVERLGQQDLLTRLDSRSHFLLRLENAIRAAVQRARFSSLILVQIDDFDGIAAALGRSSSNLVLNDIAQTLQSALSRQVVAGRLDEHVFGLWLDEGDPDAALALCKEIGERINSRVSTSMLSSLELNCSVGMTLVNGHALNAEDLLDRAYMNLQLKPVASSRPDAFSINDSLEHDAADMLAYLQTALAQRRFKPLFQPIVGISGNTRRSYEVLIRMLDKDDNEIRPGAFLSLATMNGMGEDIDRMVVQMAIDALLASREAQFLTVNITENTVMSHTFLPWLSAQLTQHRLPAERLAIDISEIVLHASPEPALSFCQGLAVLGIPLTISNFGCALEPFALLDQLKPSLVTLDETIVRDLIYSSHQKANVQSLVKALHARGVHVVTPRVEDMAVLPVLWEIGVDYAQGYCLQAPSHEMNYEFVQDEEITLSAPAQ
jgi:diguanylate cyclase (GGDEF)-like protein